MICMPGLRGFSNSAEAAYGCPDPDVPLLAGGIADEPLFAGAMLELLFIGDIAVAALGGGAAVMLGGGVAGIEAGGGVLDVDEESSFLPQALSASTAASDTAQIRGRFIFMGLLLFRGFAGSSTSGRA
jgi:hypothetical protein